MSMIISNLIQLKTLLLIVTAAGGSVATGGVMFAEYANTRGPPTFQISLSPVTLTLQPGATSTSTITLTSEHGYRGTVTLSLLFPGQTFSASVNPTRVNVHTYGATTSKLSVTAPNAVGTYSVIVIGAGSYRGRTVYQSAILTIQVASNQDFTIAATPSNITNTIGMTNTTTITVTSVNGYTGNVSLTFTAPFGYIGAVGGQALLTIQSGASATSTLTIMTSIMTAAGNYTLTVTGTDGTRTHSTTIALRVTDPAPPPVVVESLNMTFHTFDNTTSLTLLLENTGKQPVTLQSYVVQDSSGDSWSLTNWAGPTIAPNASSYAHILIGSSCPSCTYSGITGLFFQFRSGQTYTVTVTTANNNPFTYRVTDF
jgi:hypothetical protein